MPFPFHSSSVIRECLWKKTHIEKKYDFLHSHWHLPWFYFCSELHTLRLNLNLHSHDSCWTKNVSVSFTLDFKLNTFTLIQFHFYIFFYFVWDTFLSIWIINSIATSTGLINTNNRLTKNKFIKLYIDKCWSKRTWSIET